MENKPGKKNTRWKGGGGVKNVVIHREVWIFSGITQFYKAVLRKVVGKSIIMHQC